MPTSLGRFWQSEIIDDKGSRRYSRARSAQDLAPEKLAKFLAHCRAI